MLDLLFDTDPLSRTVQTFHYDDVEKQVHFVDQQDVTDLVEQNKALQNSDRKPGKDFRRVASIPLNIYFELRKLGITKDKKKFAAWLNDPDNRAFRTNNTRV